MERVLVVRVDKLGDFCHSLPAISLLKRSMPDAQIDVIVSPIIEPLAKQFDFIDNLLIYRKDDPDLVETIKAKKYQAVIVMHTHKHMAQVVKQANIPYRLGQRRKWFQYLYTHRAPLNRSACLKPEWRYCTDHIEYFLCQHHIPPADIKQRLWDISQQKADWQKFYGKADGELLIFIHPGSGGSEGSLSPEQFADIADNLAINSQRKIKFVVTFGPAEEALAQHVTTLITDKNHNAVVAKPIKDIAEFSCSLVAADMMIAGSTGPLHVASLHNTITVGFYPHESRDDKIRWQTLSDDYNRLSFSPPMGSANLALIDTQLAGRKAAEKINALPHS
ncbi:glycosyltransferase family 9 protein [Shewanella maritima]|uniref:glycosyltransferase family 9 protein n=1 Tax=Shewanella maritima TaxID=2520507 RepID=UPI003736D8B2